MRRGQRMLVDPILCSGHGHCAELLPELISLDEWGYPLLPDSAIPRALVAEARRTVAACPAMALRLVADTGSPGS